MGYENEALQGREVGDNRGVYRCGSLGVETEFDVTKNT